MTFALELNEKFSVLGIAPNVCGQIYVVGIQSSISLKIQERLIKGSKLSNAQSGN
jgi:hypothetical protein